MKISQLQFEQIYNMAILYENAKDACQNEPTEEAKDLKTLTHEVKEFYKTKPANKFFVQGHKVSWVFVTQEEKEAVTQAKARIEKIKQHLMQNTRYLDYFQKREVLQQITRTCVMQGCDTNELTTALRPCLREKTVRKIWKFARKNTTTTLVVEKPSSIPNNIKN
jgi:hypothetical protein